MRKVLTTIMILVFLLLSGGTALAHWRFGFGVGVPSPFVWASPYPGYYAPYGHYSYGYPGYRVWIPGHWEQRWTSYGWRRAWIPGYWEYR